MPTTAQHIDSVITNWLDLSLADPYVVAEWRPKILFFTKEACRQFWDVFGDDADFKHGISAALPLVAGAVAFPADFGATGYQGGVYSVASGFQLQYIQPHDFWAKYRQANPDSAGNAREYTISNGNIYTYPKTSSDSVIIHYRKRRPVLIDNNDVTGTATDNGLGAIPAEYHEGPIWWATVDMLATIGGDGRGNSELSPRAKAMFADAVAQRTQGAEHVPQIGEKGIGELEMW